METKELESIVVKAFRAAGGAQYTFTRGNVPGPETFTLTFSFAQDAAVEFYKKLNNVNLYGAGWLMSPLITDQTGEKFKIDFEKV